MDTVRLDDGTWTYQGSYDISQMHGQHTVGHGSCDFIRFYMIDANMAQVAREVFERRRQRIERVTFGLPSTCLERREEKGVRGKLGIMKTGMIS